MSDHIQALAEKLAEKYSATAYVDYISQHTVKDFTAGATDPVIRKAIELRERARVYEAIAEDYKRNSDDSPAIIYWAHLYAKAKAELAQLLKEYGIEEKA